MNAADDHALPFARAAITVQMIQDAFVLANQHALCDLEFAPSADAGDALRWLDSRPLLDPERHCPEVLDMAARSLRFAEQAGLITRHAVHRHLVRVLGAEA